MTASVLPNVGADLVRIHLAVSRAIDVVLMYSETGGPDPAQREGFALYIRCFATLVHAHHVGEDELAFPAWRKKNPRGPYNQLHMQHRMMDEIIAKLNRWLGQGDQAWDPDVLCGLWGAMVEFQTIWNSHIRTEEEYFGPGATAQFFSTEESAGLSAQISELSRHQTTPSETVLPFLLFNLPPADRREATRNIPPEVVEQLIPGPWKPFWEPMKPFLLA